MRIDEALATMRPFFSFEFFPPKDDEGVAALFATVQTLLPLRPAFVSITYGAGGSTRARTLDLAKRIQRDLGLTVLAHATCVGASRAELRGLFDDLERSGIKNVLALRGDAPKAEAPQTTPPAFEHATELIAFLKRNYSFCVGAACYPEGHLESPSIQEDLVQTRAKVDAGADFLISQLFFDNAAYFDFLARAKKARIGVPIIPGIMPITNYAQIDRFTKMCGSSIPPKLRVELEARRDEPDAVSALGVAYATLQCTELLAHAAPGVHFYTLNRSPSTRAILSALLAASAWRPFRDVTPR